MYMLPDNALGDRLNDVKAGIQPKIPINQDKYIQSILDEKNLQKQQPEISLNITIRIINMIDILITSLLYGYALKGIIVTFTPNNWFFLETIGIGFVINSMLTIIPKIYNFFKNS